MQNIIEAAQILESVIIQGDIITSQVDSAFETINNGTQAGWCSDCCTSNGNKCDPREQM